MNQSRVSYTSVQFVLDPYGLLAFRPRNFLLWESSPKTYQACVTLPHPAFQIPGGREICSRTDATVSARSSLELSQASQRPTDAARRQPPRGNNKIPPFSTPQFTPLVSTRDGNRRLRLGPRAVTKQNPSLNTVPSFSLSLYSTVERVEAGKAPATIVSTLSGRIKFWEFLHCIALHCIEI